MKKLLWFGTCHCGALDKFMRLNPRYAQEFEGGSIPFDYYGNPQTVEGVPGSVIYSYVCQTKEESVAALLRLVGDADVIIYRPLNPLGCHRITIKELLPKLKKTVQLIPLSGPFNDGFFFQFGHCRAETLQNVKNHIERNGISSTLRFYTTRGDLDWVLRFRRSLDGVKTRELRENVPVELRTSSIIEQNYQRRRLFIMHVHPSSHLFWPWALKLAEHLGIPFVGEAADPEREFPLNWAGLPEEDFVCSAAREHLGLAFPRTPWDTTSIKRGAERLAHLYKLGVNSSIVGSGAA